ncbi:MAG: type II toxin-antitoxin system VapC family toxin [Ignavibacteriae bacterium]|nr:type II toxin-antitoxin system VapC family toxin [Ignavibacteriota bacterium]
MDCVDSDAIIGILRNVPGASELSQNLDRIGNVATTSINAYEVLFGAKKSIDENKISEVRNILAKFEILQFDEKVAEEASRIHNELEKRGEQLDMRDMFIGSIALANGCTIITRNVKHFSKIKGLKVEKW